MSLNRRDFVASVGLSLVGGAAVAREAATVPAVGGSSDWAAVKAQFDLMRARGGLTVALASLLLASPAFAQAPAATAAAICTSSWAGARTWDRSAPAP